MVSLISRPALAAFCLLAVCGMSRADDNNSLKQLFAVADKLCAKRHHDQSSDAYKTCQTAQYLAIARLMQGMLQLPERDSFGVIFKHCLTEGPDISSGLPDYDAALNCVVEKVPNSRKVFFADEEK